MTKPTDFCFENMKCRQVKLPPFFFFCHESFFFHSLEWPLLRTLQLPPRTQPFLKRKHIVRCGWGSTRGDKKHGRPFQIPRVAQLRNFSPLSVNPTAFFAANTVALRAQLRPPTCLSPSVVTCRTAMRHPTHILAIHERRTR